MKSYLIQKLKNKDVWTGFVIGIGLTLSVVFGFDSELAQTAIETILGLLVGQ